MTRLVDSATRQAAALLREESASRPVLRRRDLLAMGITDTMQSALYRRGLLTRMRHGVYALSDVLAAAEPAQRHWLDAAAAIAAAEEPTWAFGPTAALLLDFPLPYDVPEAVTLVRRSHADERALRRASRHRLVLPGTSVTTGPVDESTTLVRQGVAVVGPALTAVSAAIHVQSARWRTALFDAALWQGATAQDLDTTIEIWRHLGHRPELLHAAARARPGAQTVLETLSRLAFVELGLPEPELQVAFHDADGLIGYVDMYWDGLRVIGEADGAVKYRSRDDLLREKAREDRLRARGFAVVRWTWDEIHDDPERVVARIWAASRRAA